MTVEPNFTAGAYGRITIKDIFDDRSIAGSDLHFPRLQSLGLGDSA